MTVIYFSLNAIELQPIFEEKYMPPTQWLILQNYKFV